MIEIKNNGGNRALVCYVYGSDEDYSTEARAIMRTAIKNVLETQGLDENGDVCTNEIDTPKTVAINLSSGTWARSLKIGNCSGDLLVGVYFYTAPQPVDTRGTMAEINEFFGEEVAPELPSITSLVCDALRENFGGVYGASAFVIPDDITSYMLEVE